VHVCKKAKLSSIEIEGVRDGSRQDMQLVTTLPRWTKARQVAFTQNRMFVLSTDGKVYMYKIEE
jgi:hypothetical protein